MGTDPDTGWIVGNLFLLVVASAAKARQGASALFSQPLHSK